MLPELPGLGHEPVAHPRLGTRNVAAGELGVRLGHTVLELGAAGDRLALMRCVCADLRIAGPGGKVRVGLGVGHPLDATLRDELTQIKVCFSTKDVGEAIIAFREKRTPSFQGR